MRDSWAAIKPVVRPNGGYQRIPPKIGGALFLMMAVTLVYLILPDHQRTAPSDGHPNYPLVSGKRTSDGVTFRIATVSDLDQRSKVDGDKNSWVSYLKLGQLTLLNTGKVIVEFEDQAERLVGHISEKGRAIELSELVLFNHRLYTVDDRTGIVYEIDSQHNLVPWVILRNGNGHLPEAFKAEWMAVKDGDLYVGGLGKDWTTGDGVLLNKNPKWVKIISPNGAVRHENWTLRYEALQAAAGIRWPGYIIHESAVWSKIHRRWYFLPRRSSNERYNEKEDERRGTNLMISCRDDFTDIQVSHLGDLNPTHGFSSFKFVPGTHDEVIVALKSEEFGETLASYIVAFNINGRKLMPEKKFAEAKFEGLEFL
ncbi:soluble calcium-activated nucleotidase 1-like [Sycon ciliatum]|uniref:soluble calcium-activated nucleotidase 1-like n=1 Tax=Sycon ciliatum TaxID=27933 RepID=UPI0031F6F92C